MSLPPNKNILKDHPNKWFVETGSFLGDGIKAAIEAGFENIISLDNAINSVKWCNKNYPQAKTFLANSATDLWRHIKHIGQATFFLDAHSQLFEDEIPMDDPFPLLKELEQIKRHPIKTHTIIIDDLLMMTHPDVTGWTKHFLCERLIEINPDYKIFSIANPVKNNILIATI